MRIGGFSDQSLSKTYSLAVTLGKPPNNLAHRLGEAHCFGDSLDFSGSF